jgi:hypothetical protein
MLAEKLYIDKTEDTPEINFDLGTGKFSVRGRSLPENAYNFYKPIIEFLQSAIKEINGGTDFEFHLDYFNSSSGRFIYEMLTIIESRASTNSFKINWIVDKEDELMIEKGEELQSLLDLKFEIKKI